MSEFPSEPIAANVAIRPPVSSNREKPMNAINVPIPQTNSTNHKYLALAGWILFCFAASATAVFVNTGGWYAALEKPSFNPPSWVFAPVWSTLYLLMAIAAWLVWREGGWKVQGRPLAWFVGQWALNVLWTPLFFAKHLLGPAFLEICVLTLVLLITMVLFARVRQAAALLLIPYLAWISFAGFLNLTIWRLNR